MRRPCHAARHNTCRLACAKVHSSLFPIASSSFRSRAAVSHHNGALRIQIGKKKKTCNCFWPCPAEPVSLVHRDLHSYCFCLRKTIPNRHQAVLLKMAWMTTALIHQVTCRSSGQVTMASPIISFPSMSRAKTSIKYVLEIRLTESRRRRTSPHVWTNTLCVVPWSRSSPVRQPCQTVNRWAMWFRSPT
jgi:hypothetical protein